MFEIFFVTSIFPSFPATLNASLNNPTNKQQGTNFSFW